MILSPDPDALSSMFLQYLNTLLEVYGNKDLSTPES
jgi:hypothetical protein